tara:strand:+ start:21959 stop:23626 length:1668 start_codon:yes stop_codon:yes gene_type:complete
MSEKDKDKNQENGNKEESKNPFEELQKQFQELFSSPNLNVKLAPPFETEESLEEVVEEPESDDEALKRITEFNLKPKEIRDYLNRFVIKQQEAKKVLSVSICDHYNHVRQCLEDPKLLEQEYNKQNILLLGPTGVGKTYLMRNISRLIGVPFVKADATKFSETGYMGSDVEDLVRDLVKAANGNVELAQYGIIYIDEIDKIAIDPSSNGRDVSGRGVQINLLKLMEDSEVNIFSPNDMMAQMQAVMDMGRGKKKEQKKTINTRHILFIVSGAFDKLAESIEKRVDQGSFGFASKGNTPDPAATHNYLTQAISTDFIKYGFEPEFVGRLPVRVACEPLQEDDLARILKTSEGSVLKQYRNDFKGYDIHFDIDDESIREIASQAAQEQTGARGLMTVLEKVFRDFKFELPSSAIEEFSVSKETIKDPASCLKGLLEKHAHLQKDVRLDDIKRFCTSFRNLHGFELSFDAEAADYIIQLSMDEDRTVRSVCEQRFKDFEHGLKIVSRNVGQDSFTIDKTAAMDPEKAVSDWVVKSFEDKKEEEEKPSDDNKDTDSEQT